MLVRLLSVLSWGGSKPGPTYRSECGAANDPGARFCCQCGKML